MQVSEVLETRTLLTTYFVDTTDDVVDAMDGQTSLREAMQMAEANAGPDVIRFAAGLEGAVLNITQGALPTIDESLSIIGTIGDAQTINGAGLIANASGEGNTTNFVINSVNINLAPTGAGLLINAVDDGVTNATVFNAVITNSAAQGVKFVAHTGGIVNLNMTTVGIYSNGDVTSSEGIRGEVGVDAAGAESLNTQDKFATANIDLLNVRVANHFLEGFTLLVADGGQVTTPNGIRNTTFSSNGLGNFRSGVHFSASGPGTTLSASFNSVASDKVTAAGFGFVANDGATLNTTLVNARSLNAGADALNYHYTNATGENTVNGFTGMNAGGNGVEILLFDGSSVQFNQFDNVTLNNMGGSGLLVGTLSGSTLEAFNSTNVNASSNGFGILPNEGSGVQLTTLNGTSNFVFTNLTTNNNRLCGVLLLENDGGVSTKTINNLTSTGNRLAQPLGISVGGGATLDLDVNGGTLSSAGALPGANVIFAPIRGSATANLSFDGLTLNNSSSSGIVLEYNQTSQGTVNVSNTTSTDNRGVGVALFVRGGSDVDGNFDGVDVSNAGQGAGAATGFRIEMHGPGATGDFTFNDVTADGASGAGISLLYNAGATGAVEEFNNVSAQDTGGDGVNVFVRGISTHLNAFNADGVNVSGAGLGTTATADGLDLFVVGPGTTGSFNIQNLTADAAGGSGVKLQVENTAQVDINVDGFSADNNQREGIAIDVGTIVAGAQLLGSVFANGTASSNGLAFMENHSGIRTTVQGMLLGEDPLDPADDIHSIVDIAFENVASNSNTLDGFELDAQNGAELTADLRNGVSGLGNAQHGVNFQADGADTTASLLSSVAGNNYDGNGGNGVNVLLTNAVTANEVTIKGSASTNQQDGVHITSDDASGVTINTLQVTGDNPMLNDNFGNGLVIDLDTVGGLSSLDLSSLTVNDNVLDQINVRLANMTLQDVSLADIDADGPGAGMGVGDGIELTLDNTDITNLLELNGITAVNNGEDGLQLNFLGGASIPMGSVIDIGTFDDNGQHGVNLNINASTISLSLTNSMAAMGSIASMSDNGGRGLNVELRSATFTLGEVDNQRIRQNGVSGVFVQSVTPSTFISNNSFTNNTISDNGGFGFRGIFNGGTFDISIGETGSGNLLESNVGAGIAIDMVQNSTGQLRIVDNEITDTSDGTGVFNGEGIFIRQLGTVNPAQATNSLENLSDPPGAPGLLIQNNRIGVDDMDMAAGNASHGITFQLEEQSSIGGLHVHDNLISNNGNDGLNFVRLDQVDIDDFEILRNEITDNANDGVELLGQNDTTDAMFVRIDDNDISSNGAMGLAFQVNADARISVDIDNNMIVQNGVDGIQTREVVLDLSDNRQILGTWSNNVIADNTRHGIELNAATGGGLFTPTPLLVRDNAIGATFDEFGQMLLDGNGSTGIEINAAGASEWNNNEIIRNGRAVVNNRALGHGVDIQSVGFKNNIFRGNLIRENFQDGIEWVNNTTSVFNLTLDDNRIQNNAGRGLDVLNQENTGTSAVTIMSSSNDRTNNQFSSNGEEGIYIVNTSSTTQNQTDFSGTALQQDGAVTRTPDLQLSVSDATISNNGSAANTPNMVASAGIILRVGTSDRNASPTTAAPGTLVESFATNGFSPTVINGGVSAELIDSSLHGNFGDDVFIHGYVSTADPATLNGSWTEMEFDLNNPNNGDPLARLDLVWGISDFDSLDVNNSLRRGTPGGEAGAYYDNGEGTFKSRTGNLMPPGPHNQNQGPTRRRNAQRVPARTLSDGSQLSPQISPDGGAFVFPGWGASTFRVRSASGASLNPFGSVNFTPNTTTGELPFTWGGYQPSKTMGNGQGIDYTEGNPPVGIDNNNSGDIQDVVLDALNGGNGNYDGASLTVSRQGGDEPEDNFGFQNGAGLTLVGNQIVKNGNAIASFNVSPGGTLTINFTDANGEIPTSADVDQVLQRITYENTSVVPPQSMMGMPSLTLAVVFDNGLGLGSGTQAVCLIDVDITPVNSPPTISDLGPAGVFMPGGDPVKLDLDGNADIEDTEMDFLNMGLGNYAMATLTVARLGGANADDAYSFLNGNGLTLNGNNIQKNGETIATFMDNNGTLTIAFTDANGEIPTSADVDNILQQICYENTNATPPNSVTLEVEIDDGGVGGGMAEQGSATVTVQINDNNAPVIAGLGPAEVFVTGEANTLIDNDGNATISDAELDALGGGNGNYDGARLTIVRQGGPNADDFSFQSGNGLNLVGNEIRKAGQSIASFDIVGGMLIVDFTDTNGQVPTTADVSNVLRQIAYANTNFIPPDSVVLDVTIDDGDAFALQDTASVTVFINSPPEIFDLGPPSATFSGTPVLIDDGDALIRDEQLDPLNGGMDNFAGSMLTVSRNGGANGDDFFTFMDGNGLVFNANTIEKNGQSIASFVDDGAGTLTIAFTDANGEAPMFTDVSNVLQQILYENLNPAPGMITLDVTFDDGGVAGGMKPRQDTEMVTITIV